MLTISIPATEQFDELKQEFVSTKATTLQLEHSLVSLSKWESKWKKAFLSKIEKTREETIDYIRCMTITQNVDPNAYYCIPSNEIQRVNNYIEDSMTATTFSESGGKPNKEVITAELIYYWMIALNIPFECRKWHLNQLLTLIRVCEIKNSPRKKRGINETLNSYAAINAARRKKLGTKG